MTKILGVQHLCFKLSKIPDAVQAAVRLEMAKIADEIVSMMKRLAPEDTGALRRSIGWTWGKAPKGTSIVAAVKPQNGNDMTITIYAGSAEAYYARWQEFGTQDMPAHPYFYVSWRANRKAAKRGVRKAIRKGMAGFVGVS